MKQKASFWQWLTVVLFGALIVVLPIVTLALPKQTVSEAENRTLASAPTLSFNSYKDASFMQGVGDFLSDHFVGRTQWISLKNNLLYATGSREFSGVFVTPSGETAGGNRMIPKGGAVNNRYFAQNILKVDEFAQTTGKPTTLMVVPSPAGVYADLLPNGADVTDEAAALSTVQGKLSRRVQLIDLYPTMQANKADEIYYRTDHHWTSKGAYLGYVQLAKALNFTPLPRSEFEIETLQKPFEGTSQSKCLITPGVQADRVELWRHASVSDGVRVIDEKGTLLSNSPFFLENAQKKDLYTCFLGENRGVTIIDNPNAPKGSLLVCKDSYANALAPFLAAHYQKVVLVDLRYYREMITDLEGFADFDQTVFLYGMDAFVSQNQLAKLMF